MNMRDFNELVSSAGLFNQLVFRHEYEFLK